MKVLHIESGKNLYGGAQQVVYLINDLEKQGVENYLLCPKKSAIAQALSPPAAKILPLKTGLGLGLHTYLSIKKAIRKSQADIVHIHSRRGAVDYWGGVAANHLRIPAVISRRVDNPESRWVVKRKYARYQHVITISEGIRQVLLKEGLAAEKVTTVRSAVDVADFSEDCHRQTFLDTFQLDPGCIVIGVIAQLIERKGHRHLLEVLPALIQQYPKLQVLIFGKGRLENELRNRIVSEQLHPHVQLAGFRQDLAKWLPCLDMVVHPADMEGLGVALIQAAASSVPVIATRAGGMPEIIRDGDNGLLINPGDTPALKRAILALLKDPEKRARMGQRGRKRVEKEFSTRAMAAGNLAIYQYLLGENKR